MKHNSQQTHQYGQKFGIYDQIYVPVQPVQPIT